MAFMIECPYSQNNQEKQPAHITHMPISGKLSPQPFAIQEKDFKIVNMYIRKGEIRRLLKCKNKKNKT